VAHIVGLGLAETWRRCKEHFCEFSAEVRTNTRPHKPNTAQDDSEVIMNVINLFAARREAIILTHRLDSPA